MEAFNEAVQKWVPVDPLVTKTVAKGFRFEPPAKDPHNAMTYVIAFEKDGSARDVTRRYACAFNAKTRKQRVESTKGGEEWWERTMRFYEKPFLEDRDQIEIGELTARAAAERMPRNAQDFKDHPFYALERHLRRNETIFPKRPIGQLGSRAGSKRNTLEPVYRRSDVHTLRSANGWYRLGRDIKLGEQPLKHVRSNRNGLEANRSDYDDDGSLEMALYAYFQTIPYEPPPVVEGRVPKNVYGNLDIYVPSMVPAGAIHVRHRDAVQATRILGIDYAEAVTGFDFKGRRGTAVVDGIVVAREFHEALREVIRGLEDERLEAQLEATAAEALGLWRHFLLRLRIAERVKGYAVEGEEPDAAVAANSSDEAAEEDRGFLPDPEQNAPDKTTTTPEADEIPGGGFVAEVSTKNVASQSASPVHGTYAARSTPRKSLQSQSRFILSVSPNIKSKKPVNRSTSVTEDVQARQDPNAAAPETTVDASQETTEVHLDRSSENPVAGESSTEGKPNAGSVGEGPSQPQSPKADREESDASSVDVVSLLSEDPEDEDAVPEWLV